MAVTETLADRNVAVTATSLPNWAARADQAAGVLLADLGVMTLVTVPSADLVIRSAIKIHSELGPGLFETVYTRCLVHELHKAGARVRQQVRVPLNYDGVVFDCAFRADLIVEEELIVEVKSIEKLSPMHFKQLLTYLRLAKIRKGLLINFSEALLKDGLKSVVADPRSPGPSP